MTPPSRHSFDPPREAARDALIAVDRDGAYLNLLLPRMLRERSITGRDAAFATEIAYGSARRSGVLLQVIEAAARRDPASLDVDVRSVLTLGAYQILHTRVPDRAAVSTSVEAIRAVAGPRPTGLVNAVLRRIGERSWGQWCQQLAPSHPLERVAFEAGYPSWIAQAFAAAFGTDDPNVLAEMLADKSPQVHLAARPGRIDRDALMAEVGGEATTGRWSPWAVELARGDPADIPSVRVGDAGVQDEGSQLVALALANATLDREDGGRWLDMCAGPGGKAALLEGCLPPGGRLLAADVTPHRAALVAGSLRQAMPIVGDGRVPAWRDGAFDRVLVDAPCSGLGSLRRRPESRWRRHPGDVDRIAALQRELLTRAADAARPGGVIAYATCSPHLGETREVVDAVVSSGLIERLDTWSALPMIPRSSSPSSDPRDVQLWPHVHGTDAMFVALLRRRS